ncbi:unnamed protein product [Linum trigynum]|uniref:Uncharacterized protein n=1 Tax=Linum trigynum TaxID=586398 RepID=A0AAV2E1S9_9ROSI
MVSIGGRKGKDPIHTDHKNNDNNNVKFCNLGCLATALTARDPSVLAIMSEGEAEEVAERMVNGCSSTCSKKL